jgi:crotonobetainyl-CoA:carnitine CoA-transferase CaiB-like acyl-CoA transferase
MAGGRAPPRPRLTRGVLPLADVRVLAVEQFGAGPWATLQLADLGAEVIKIEDPASAGDVGRYVPPFQEGEDSLFFETFNRNKKSISLDLRAEAGRRRFEALVPAADVVFSNLRGDQPAKLRLLYDDLKHLNPRVVCCSLSGFGMTGPRAAEGGYDYMMQGLAGWMQLTGEPDGPPTKSGLSLVDLSGGYAAAIAIMAGLWRARRDGTGCDCDVSLLDVALHELMYIGTWAASRGYVPPRRAKSAHPSLVPFQNFETADGWIVVAAPKEKFWERVCEAIGRPELVSDPRFADFGARDRNRDELAPILDEAFRAHASAEWLQALRAAGVPCSPVHDVLEAVEEARLVEYEHPTLGAVRQVASPLRLSDADPPVSRAPFRGEHDEEVDDLVGA